MTAPGDNSTAGTIRESIDVLIVDDQPVVRAGVARILSPADGFNVVGERDDGDELVAAVTELTPDLVLLDVRMRRLSGPAALIRLRQQHDDPPPVLMFTTFDDDDALWGALEAGADGFVLKDCGALDLIAACRTAAAGGAWLDPQVATRVMASVRRRQPAHRRAEQRVEQLTDREHEVLRLMARGATNSEIAEQLMVSGATVKSHVGAIFAKLGARDRAAAIVFAYDHGLIEPGG